MAVFLRKNSNKQGLMWALRRLAVISFNWSGMSFALSFALLICGAALQYQLGVTAWYIYPIIAFFMALRAKKKAP
ncbi:hypothetical protein CI741_08995 [Klebsiella pneumoniae subsp. pneumoniae]|nr:hypothetical protein CI741_08995 [Klebsiella pneumoniae subsp. pneumoniae]